jgi:hypothetical protein
MKHFIRSNARPLFYATWAILGLLQATFTELQDDEAYYWVFSHYLDWGYFDHPPMTAVLIKWGTGLFGGQLGVRFFMLLVNTLTIYITEKLVAPKNVVLFYAVVLSAGVLQLIGYWAVPDIPLLFFTALFFWCYKRWIKDFSLANTALFAVACALLMYTKYHGALIIIFTILSNWKLLLRWQLWAAGIFAFILFAPHLWWQYEHNWMSFRYHLFESNVNPYKFSYTTEYLSGQLLIAGPLAGIIFWAAAFKYKAQNAFEKALKFTAIGFLVFFFLSSFKGRVEANWTAPAVIPLLVLTYYFVVQKGGWRKWLLRLLPPTLILVFIFKLLMIFDVLPVKTVVKMFHAWKGWPTEMKTAIQNTPIVFSNSYQRASKAWFYTGNMAYSQNSFKERRSNYNFWPVEDSLLGKGVYFMDIYDLHRFPDSIQARQWTIGYRYDSAFHSFAKIVLQPQQSGYTVKEGETFQILFNVVVPPHYKTYLQQHPEVDMPVKIGVFQKRDWVKDMELPLALQSLIQSPTMQVPLTLGLPKGDYFLRVAIGSSTGIFTHNSDKINVSVK